MAVENRKRKLPEGIRQRGKTFEGRVSSHGKSYSVHGKTITETRTKLLELKYKLSIGSVTENSKMLFGEWFSLWMEEYKKFSIKAGTYETYRQYYNSLIKPDFSEMRLSDIRCVDIQRLFNSLYEKGYSSSTIKIVFVLINGALHRAEINGMLERNPAKNIQLPKAKSKFSRNALTREQQKIFSDFSKESKMHDLFALMLRTGLRNGELRALKYNDIDFENHVLHIRRTLKYIDHRGFFEDTPKTRSSVRDIPLTKNITSLLNAQNPSEHSPNEYIFKNSKGKPLCRDSVQYELDKIIKRINESGYNFERITPHVFRHTFATRAIEAGMSPQVLKTILGHSSLAITMDLYSHVMPDIRANEMERISDAF